MPTNQNACADEQMILIWLLPLVMVRCTSSRCGNKRTPKMRTSRGATSSGRRRPSMSPTSGLLPL